MKQTLTVALVSLLAAGSALWSSAAELGRKKIESNQVVKDYVEPRIDHLPGAEVGWDVSMINWKVGDQSYSDKSGSPSASLFYGVNESCDIRATLRLLTAEDVDGANESDFTSLGLGFGTRLWFKAGTDFYPYAGALLNYYFMDDDHQGSMDGSVGMSLEAGVAYLIQNTIMVRAGLCVDTTILDGEVIVDGAKEDVSFSSVSGGLGLVILF